jgi:hypothetical protein
MAYGWVPPPQVTVAAREIVATKAFVWITHRRADLIGCIGKKRIAIFDKLTEWIAANRGNIGRRHLCQIDNAWFCCPRQTGDKRSAGWDRHEH